MKLHVLSATAFATVMALSGTAHSQDIFIDGDMVRGAKDGAPGGAVIDVNPDGAPICVLTNQFKHLEKIVFRFRVRDQSGKMLDNDGLKSLVVELPSGERFSANYGPHAPLGPTDYFWTVVWVIPVFVSEWYLNVQSHRNRYGGPRAKLGTDQPCDLFIAGATGRDQREALSRDASEVNPAMIDFLRQS